MNMQFTVPATTLHTYFHSQGHYKEQKREQTTELDNLNPHLPKFICECPE
jgi:hypothetical protein